FQAEDGIRVFHVTGVQTCALPISAPQLRDAAASTVVFHCRSGMRTRANAAALEAAAGGREVLLLDGGIDAWKQAGLPVVREAGEIGRASCRERGMIEEAAV